MMKKQGFTLAEVLITLTIIGVVAVLTLPALMTNTQEQQAKTALRKMANTMTNSANMAAAKIGFDYTAVTDLGAAKDPVSETNTTFLNILKNTTKVSSDDVASATGAPSFSKKLGVSFNDGTYLYLATMNGKETTEASDGHINGFLCVFDTNGTKGPNIISNCQGKTTAAGITGFNGDSTANCGTKGKKVIRDQFMMRLRNDIVAPVGAASAYLLNDDLKSNSYDLGGSATYGS